MTVAWFNSERSGYFIGPLEEFETNFPGGLLVEKRIGIEYVYNFEANIWEKTEVSVRKAWQAMRNGMLLDTAWLIGTDSPLTPDDELSLRQWRRTCELMFSGPPANVEAPVYPDYVLPWVVS